MLSNSKLLETAPTANLGGLERQRRFVLQQLTRPMGCPSCGQQQTYAQARRVAVDDLDLNESNDGPFQCIACDRKLLYTIPMMGDCHWRLVPVEAKAGAQ